MLFCNRRRRAFCFGNAVDYSHAQRAEDVRGLDTFTSIFVNGSFHWAHLTSDGHLWVGTTRSTRTFRTGGWWKSGVLRITACEASTDRETPRPSRRSGCVQGSISPRTSHVRSALPASFHFCCAHRYYSWWTFSHFLAQTHLYAKLTSEHLSFSIIEIYLYEAEYWRALQSWQCIRILWYANKTFSFRFWPRPPPPPPPFVGNTDLKKFRKLQTTPKWHCWAIFCWISFVWKRQFWFFHKKAYI